MAKRQTKRQQRYSAECGFSALERQYAGTATWGVVDTTTGAFVELCDRGDGDQHFTTRYQARRIAALLNSK